VPVCGRQVWQKAAGRLNELRPLQGLLSGVAGPIVMVSFRAGPTSAGPWFQSAMRKDTMSHLQIDIVSDVACPWCAIGYRRLEQAMSELESEFTFSVKWNAFRLNPDMPPEGEPILEHLCRKYGRSPDEIEATQDQLIAIAGDLGLNFSKARERRACDTLDCHRLLMWAGEKGRQTELKLALFDAYFGHARDLTDPEVLSAAAGSAGLSEDEAADILASDRYRNAVLEEEERFKQAGISAVPAFIVDGRYLISGAQEPATLVEAFRQIASQTTDPASGVGR